MKLHGVDTRHLPILGKRSDIRMPEIKRSDNRAPKVTSKTEYENKWSGVKADDAQARDIELATIIGDKLTEHYPGHPWYVEVDSNGRMVHISIPVLMHNHRFNIRMRDLHSDPGLKLVIRAGGEILERWKMPRTTMNVADFKAAQRHRIHGPKDKAPV